MQRALIDSIQRDLDAVYKDDEVKPVCAPFFTLASDMVRKLPAADSILVISDLGLLAAAMRKYEAENITFAAHNEKQEKMSQSFGVKTLHIGYNNPIEELEKQLMGMKFDIIIGNPPYQGSSSAGNKTHSLWKKFIKLAFKVKNDDGVIMMITPSTWISCRHMSKLFLSGNLESAEIINAEIFKVGVTVSWWFWKPGAYNGTRFTANDKTQLVQFTKVGVVPSRIISDESIAIQRKTLLNELPLGLFSCQIFHAHKEQTEQYKWPIFNTHAQQLSWANKKPTDLLYRKVIFSNVGTFCPVYDEGTRGTCWHSHSYIVRDEQEGNALIKYLNSKLIRFLNFNNRSGGFMDPIFPKGLPAINYEVITTDDEIYNYFNLTQSEINLIEQTVK